MERKRVLQTAIDYTCNERQDAYGEPYINMGCIGEMFAVYQKYAGNKHTPGHDACILQVLTKVSRIACGKLKDDNYIDLAAYAGMAYECDMQREKENELKSINEKAQRIYDGVEDLGECIKGDTGQTGSTTQSASAYSNPSMFGLLFSNLLDAADAGLADVYSAIEKHLAPDVGCGCDECKCEPEGKKE